ncbi:peptide deformylase [Streptomyces microflavus]|uniref:peptide deformylase n=2 Tax=Streptomyces microflavus TaxID=1919 RepID=UPI002E32E216|nr:peptide deformylase [Streptomyces microflavus]
MGLAAPQIGISRAAAVVQPSGGAPPIVLFNPRITDCCDETDEHYEGCLSFFDVRGLVPRPVKITVETETRTGETVTTEYARGLARLVHHEIDHLSGLLCTVRMRTGVDPIPVEQYRQTGQGSVGWATLRCTATRPRNFCGRPGPSGSELSTADSTSEGRHSRKEVAALGARCSVPQAPSERRPRPRCRRTDAGSSSPRTLTQTMSMTCGGVVDIGHCWSPLVDP